MSKMKEIKRLATKQKKLLIGIGCVCVSAGVGVVGMWKFAKIRKMEAVYNMVADFDKVVLDRLMDAAKMYKKDYDVFACKTTLENGISMNKLEGIRKMMEDVGVSESQVFTHFIAIGPPTVND